MLKADFEKLIFFFTAGFFYLTWILAAFLIIYSVILYRQLIKAEPELFPEEKLTECFTSRRFARFKMYTMFDGYKKIRDKALRRKCEILIKINYFFYFVFFMFLFFIAVRYFSKENLLIGIKAFGFIQK